MERKVRLAVRRTAACGAPSAPTSADLPYVNGVYYITLTSPDISSNPSVPTCPPLFVPLSGKSVTTRVALAREGGEWVGRSVADDGSLLLPIRRTGQSNATTATVSGTLVGSGRDVALELKPPLDVNVVVGSSGGEATLDGTVPLFGNFSSGIVTGRLVW